MDLATRKKRLRQTGYWCSLDISGAGFVVVFFTLLVMMMVEPAIFIPSRLGVDLAKTPHAVKMPGMLREDALVIAVMRDGTYYVNSDKISPDQIAFRLKKCIGSGSERKVYIKADARTKYGNVEAAIDAVHDVGIEQIGLVTSRPQDVVEP